MTAAEPDAGGQAQQDAGQPASAAQGPLRVTTLELFFDLVFAFTLTQLAAMLDTGLGRPRRRRRAVHGR